MAYVPTRCSEKKFPMTSLYSTGIIPTKLPSAYCGEGSCGTATYSMCKFPSQPISIYSAAIGASGIPSYSNNQCFKYISPI